MTEPATSHEHTTLHTIPATKAPDGEPITEGALVRLWAESSFDMDGVTTSYSVEITTPRGRGDVSVLPEQVPDLIDALREVQQHMR